jgi:hypothetical protein
MFLPQNITQRNMQNNTDILPNTGTIQDRTTLPALTAKFSVLALQDVLL